VNRIATALAAALGFAFAGVRALPAQSAAPAAVKACSLVSKDDVKKHLPWIAALDNMPIEEEPIGASGSSCNYPSVFVQVLPFSPRTMEMVRKKPGVEAVSGVGDEAYLHNNRGEYAELYVKAGSRFVTLQANLEGDMASVKPGVLHLAKALLARLR
jgi:hypothetical protein